MNAAYRVTRRRTRVAPLGPTPAGRDGGAGAGRGFTLVEMILAVTLTAIVLTAVGQIATQLLRAEAAVEAGAADAARIEYPFSLLAADLQDRVPPASRVDVRLDANHRPVIGLTCLAVEPDAVGHAARIPARITYELRATESADTHLRWVRQMQPLVDHASAATTVVACGLASIDVDVRISGRWQAAAEVPPRNKALPDALRVTLHWNVEPRTATRLWALSVAPSQEEPHAR